MSDPYTFIAVNRRGGGWRLWGTDKSTESPDDLLRLKMGIAPLRTGESFKEFLNSQWQCEELSWYRSGDWMDLHYEICRIINEFGITAPVRGWFVTKQESRHAYNTYFRELHYNRSTGLWDGKKLPENINRGRKLGIDLSSEDMRHTLAGNLVVNAKTFFEEGLISSKRFDEVLSEIWEHAFSFGTTENLSAFSTDSPQALADLITCADFGRERFHPDDLGSEEIQRIVFNICHGRYVKTLELKVLEDAPLAAGLYGLQAAADLRAREAAPGYDPLYDASKLEIRFGYLDALKYLVQFNDLHCKCEEWAQRFSDGANAAELTLNGLKLPAPQQNDSLKQNQGLSL